MMSFGAIERYDVLGPGLGMEMGMVLQISVSAPESGMVASEREY